MVVEIQYSILHYPGDLISMSDYVTNVNFKVVDKVSILNIVYQFPTHKIRVHFCSKHH